MTPHTYRINVYVDDVIHCLNGGENPSKIVFPLLLSKTFTGGNLLSEKEKAADMRCWQF